MKVKINPKIIADIVNDPEKAKNAKIKIDDPWWVIALKVLAYLIGLLLCGAGTAEAATLMNIM